jgi:hypothetical protein
MTTSTNPAVAQQLVNRACVREKPPDPIPGEIPKELASGLNQEGVPHLEGVRQDPAARRGEPQATVDGPHASEPLSSAPHNNADNPGCGSDWVVDEETAALVPSFPGEDPQERQAAGAQLQELAHRLKDEHIATYLGAITSRVAGSGLPPPPLACHRYLTQLRRDAGDPADPVERMMIEQIALAHHKIGELYYRARRANSPEKVKVYNAAIAALLGEFRRMALALKSYREPTPAKHVTVVRQQNLAQSQQVAYLDGEMPHRAEAGSEKPENRPHTKLASKRANKHVPRIASESEPQARCSRKKESAAAKGLDPEGQGEAAGGSTSEPALAVLNGAKNGSRQSQCRCQRQNAPQGKVLRPRAESRGR